MHKIKSSEITPEHLYATRRNFIKNSIWAFGAAASAAALAACGASGQAQPAATPAASESASTPAAEASYASGVAELQKELTPLESIANYNNYYEFSTDKEAVAGLAANFKTTPWKVEVGGLVNKPMTLDIDDLRTKFTQEERIYRLRCVEGWSMVVPWTGFPLAQLLKQVEPKANAKFVSFISLNDPGQMPGQNDIFSGFQWPYAEALRLDEAMNDLTLLVTGLYGKALPNQNGAPLRLAVPWKYGFKSAKAIVKIELTEEQPKTFWTIANPAEYGFYANVNPDVPHPRWTQSSERRIGETSRRRTLLFNGYADQVAALYKDLDLKANP